MSLASLFLVVGAALLSLLLVKLAIPGYFASAGFASYGRLRPVAFALLVYGFGGTLAQAIAYYLTPRLTGARLRHERLATINGYAYSLLIIAGAAAVMLVGVDGREFGEFPLVVDALLLATMLVPLYSVMRTVSARTEDGMYVSLFYILGSLLWYPALHIVANVDGFTGAGNLLATGVISSGFVTLAFPRRRRRRCLLRRGQRDRTTAVLGVAGASRILDDGGHSTRCWAWPIRRGAGAGMA